MFKTGANLFTSGDFISHAGLPLKWKIECDAIRPEEWDCLAQMIMDYEKFPFKEVKGIPSGGLSLASSLDKYKSPDADDLVMVVDDVWTTGTSMRDFIKENYPGYLKGQVKKWVVFARRPPDDGTRALFTMPG